MGFLLGDDTGYAGPDAGAVARGVVPPQNFMHDVGGQQVTPWGYQVFPEAAAPAPILNGVPNEHPLAHVANLITDHANVLRQRLLSGHLQQGFAPEGQEPMNLLQSLPAATRNPSYSHLAQLLARFHRG